MRFCSSPNMLLQIGSPKSKHATKVTIVRPLTNTTSALTDIVCAFFLPPPAASEWLLYGTYNMWTLSLWGDRGLLLWKRKWPCRTPGDLRGKVLTPVWPFCLSPGFKCDLHRFGCSLCCRQQCAGNSLRGASVVFKVALASSNIDNFLKILSNFYLRETKLPMLFFL